MNITLAGYDLYPVDTSRVIADDLRKLSDEINNLTTAPPSTEMASRCLRLPLNNTMLEEVMNDRLPEFENCIAMIIPPNKIPEIIRSYIAQYTGSERNSFQMEFFSTTIDGEAHNFLSPLSFHLQAFYPAHTTILPTALYVLILGLMVIARSVLNLVRWFAMYFLHRASSPEDSIPFTLLGIVLAIALGIFKIIGVLYGIVS